MATATGLNLDSAELKKSIERFQSVREDILTQVRQVIVGQEDVLDQILLSLFVGGHCLITGLPGTAKTLMVRTISQTLGLVFKRIQFTPDLMPADITGTDIIEEDPTTGHRRWTFVPGPIFGNIVLADEINRTPPKTQSALLEAMQELSCTVRGNHYKLPAPFFVLATQNPIELEGTYPLPEAQLDRFLLKIKINYPSADEEMTILEKHNGQSSLADTSQVEITSIEGDALQQARRELRELKLEPTLLRYISEIARRTRSWPSVSLGASPRAAISLMLVAKALAALNDRDYVIPDDVKAAALPALRHRIVLRPEAELEGFDSDRVLTDVLAAVEVPK